MRQQIEALARGICAGEERDWQALGWIGQWRMRGRAVVLAYRIGRDLRRARADAGRG